MGSYSMCDMFMNPPYRSYNNGNNIYGFIDRLIAKKYKLAVPEVDGGFNTDVVESSIHKRERDLLVKSIRYIYSYIKTTLPAGLLKPDDDDRNDLSVFVVIMSFLLGTSRASIERILTPISKAYSDIDDWMLSFGLDVSLTELSYEKKAEFLLNYLTLARDKGSVHSLRYFIYYLSPLVKGLNNPSISKISLELIERQNDAGSLMPSGIERGLVIGAEFLGKVLTDPNGVHRVKKMISEMRPAGSYLGWASSGEIELQFEAGSTMYHHHSELAESQGQTGWQPYKDMENKPYLVETVNLRGYGHSGFTMGYDKIPIGVFASETLYLSNLPNNQEGMLILDTSIIRYESMIYTEGDPFPGPDFIAQQYPTWVKHENGNPILNMKDMSYQYFVGYMSANVEIITG